MKLTRGEFCQFNLYTRFQLLKEFGISVMEKKVRRRQILIYIIWDFYVEVYVRLPTHQLEKVEPVKNLQIINVYNSL
jgi:hypothetical protein